MHEMQTIVTDVCGVCLSVSLSVMWAHLVQPLPNYFGLLLQCSVSQEKRKRC